MKIIIYPLKALKSLFSKMDNWILGFCPGTSISLGMYHDYINLIDWASIINTGLVGFVGGVMGMIGKLLIEFIYLKITKRKNNETYSIKNQTQK